jgi:hypothetical protein
MQSNVDMRELAIQLVDGIHGFTMEHAPDPEFHRSSYDWVEEKLRSSLKHDAGQGWISVSERLPEYDTDVQLWAEEWPSVYVGYWRHSHEWIGRYRAENIGEKLPDTNPTHWAPLLDPPATHLDHGDPQETK